MFLCCRESIGIIEDIQDSMNEVKLEENEEDNVRIIDKRFVLEK